MGEWVNDGWMDEKIDVIPTDIVKKQVFEHGVIFSLNYKYRIIEVTIPSANFSHSFSPLWFS